MTTTPLISPSAASSITSRPLRRWSPVSVVSLTLAWLILQIGGLFTPGLLDDVDSIYIEIAREMLRRHDFVTPYINGIRFFDKPPLMYWMASSSMAVFGIHDWAARLPLALGTLALLLAVYALGIRLFAEISPAAHPDRGGFYAALALATSIGPYLYTRFYIPDILLALWMTLAVHLFLIALDRIKDRLHSTSRSAGLSSEEDATSTSAPQNISTEGPQRHVISTEAAQSHRAAQWRDPCISPLSPTPLHKDQSPVLPCLAFAAVMALNVLTKGLIGLIFPIAFVLLYLALTRQLRLLPRFHLVSSTAVFLAIAAPWHILAALRNPAIALPRGLGLPATGGWAWFYLYNEHVARFLGRRIPHDYGQVPIPLFWLLTAIWIMPWAAFLPGALAHCTRILRHRITATARQHEASLSLLLWALLVLGFFTLSSRQEYYGLPALPALALLAAALLTRADAAADAVTSAAPPNNVISTEVKRSGETPVSFLSRQTDSASRSALNWSLYFLVPLATAIAAVCGYFAVTAPRPAPGTDIASLLAANPKFYNLSLGHLFDLTGAAMGLFRGPLTAVALSMIAIGLGTYLLRRSGRAYAANLTLAAAMIVTLLAAHVGLARFYPTLGSKGLAEAINQARQADPKPNDLIILDGELTSGSTLIFYTGQQVHLIHGRVNGLWYGSLWPDAPAIFETESSLRQLWASPRRVFLFTYKPEARIADLAPIAPVHTLAAAGGKTVLTNR